MKKSAAEKIGEQNRGPKPSFAGLELEKRVERIERILALIISDLNDLKKARI